MKCKEIGSEFPLSIFNNKIQMFVDNATLLSTGRDCIDAIIKKLNLKNGDVVLLPSYLCETMLKPFYDNKLNIIFYRIKSNLKIDVNDLTNKLILEKPKLLFVIHYFGFIHDEINQIYKLVKENNTILIEDLVQAAFTKYEPKDIYFTSYRKFIGTPDGALLNLIDIKTYKSISHFVFVLLRVSAAVLKKYKFLKFSYIKLFKVAERLIEFYKKPAKCSIIGRKIIRGINHEKIVSSRRENYNYLLKLRNKNIVPLYLKLTKEVCPLGFPIVMKNNKSREVLKKLLIKNRIYPPVHWTLPEAIDKNEFKESWDLSSRILTIPIDQRYNKKDMEKIKRCLESSNL